MAINIWKSCKSVFAYVKNRSFPSHIRSSFPWRPPLAEILDPRLRSESMDLDCEQLRVKFQNKNLCQFEPIEYWRQAESNLSKTKIAFILIKYSPFKL